VTLFKEKIPNLEFGAVMGLARVKGVKLGYGFQHPTSSCEGLAFFYFFISYA
jgi:hypothetical protein